MELLFIYFLLLLFLIDVYSSFSSDCIGSAFNVKGAMECPNCREIENGVWRHFENQTPEIIYEETFDEDAEEFEMVKMRSSLVCVFYIITSYLWYQYNLIYVCPSKYFSFLW
jgi:hypothetical protein